MNTIKIHKITNPLILVSMIVTLLVSGPIVFASAVAPESSETDADYEKGQAYLNGIGVPKDEKAATLYYLKSAQRGFAPAQNALGLCYVHGWGVEQSFGDAALWFRKAAEQGNRRAQFNLGCCYESGKGEKLDYAQALSWYRKSAAQGHADAQHNIGIIYRDGLGVEKNLTEARLWFKAGADHGSAPSQQSLGHALRYGEGGAQDLSEAIKYYKLAADQGNAIAQASLGIIYMDGIGVEINLVEARFWFKAGADQGHAVSQLNLGWLFEHGKGGAKDLSEAIKYYKLAADQGDASAQLNYYRIVLNGEGHLKKDADEALSKLSKAADDKDARSILIMSDYYYNYKGTKRGSKHFAMMYAYYASKYGIVSGDYIMAELHSRGYTDSANIEGQSKRFTLPADKKKAQALYLSLVKPENLEKIRNEKYVSEENLYLRLVNNSQSIGSYDVMFKYSKKGAAMGDARAIYNLGLCYEEGYGCEPSLQKAYAYYVNAQQAGEAMASERLYELENPAEWDTCSRCSGKGMIPQTTQSFETCRRCGGAGGQAIRRHRPLPRSITHPSS